MTTCLTQSDKAILNIVFNKNLQLQKSNKDKDTIITLYYNLNNINNNIIKDQSNIILRDKQDSLTLSNNLSKQITINNKLSYLKPIIIIETILLILETILIIKK